MKRCWRVEVDWLLEGTATVDVSAECREDAVEQAEAELLELEGVDVRQAHDIRLDTFSVRELELPT